MVFFLTHNEALYIKRQKLNYNCDIKTCEQNCITFEFEYEEVRGIVAMSKMFQKIQEDVKTEFGNGVGRYGVIIKGKIIGSDVKYNPDKLRSIDLNIDGRLDDKGIMSEILLASDEMNFVCLSA